VGYAHGGRIVPVEGFVSAMSKEKNFISSCPTCGSPAIRKVSGTRTGTFGGETYAVKGLEYYACPNCQEKVYPPAAMRKIQQASPAYSKRPARLAGRPARKPEKTIQS
jgi:YgiT-type zinc finger domain-containing protein